MAKKTVFILTLLFSLCCFSMAAQSTTTKRTIVVTAERSKFIDKAKQLIGSPYVYGAVGPDSFDCSGLIYYAARESIQFQLPRTARAIYNFCRVVKEDEREPGDLLFFKTTSSNYVSHVGIYIGNKQFISAISDGPNTGVIVSSLNQEYWKTRYFSTGRFLETAIERDEKKQEEEAKTPAKKEDKTESKAAAKPKEESEKKTAAAEKPKPKDTKPKPDDTKPKPEDKKLKPTDKPSLPVDPKATAKADAEKKNQEESEETSEVETEAPVAMSWKEAVIFDASIYGAWSFFDYEKFGFFFRGIDADFVVSNYNWVLNPGLGIFFRANVANKLFQIPVVLTLTLNDYIRLYAGPVFSFAPGSLSDKSITSSIYPGIVGVAFSTPAIKAGKTKIQFVQDVSYTFYNEIDGSALNFQESFGNGVSFYTGIKVTFPLEIFFRESVTS